MRAYFKKDGVLKISPEDHGECIALKSFIKELQTHGVKMLDIDTDCDESMATNAYGRQSSPNSIHHHYPAYGISPIQPMGAYWPPDYPRYRGPRSVFDEVYPDDDDFETIEGRRGGGGGRGRGGRSSGR
jgi:hypothetical protein